MHLGLCLPHSLWCLPSEDFEIVERLVVALGWCLEVSKQCASSRLFKVRLQFLTDIFLK